MPLVQNLSVRTRLLAGFSVVLLLMAGLGAVALSGLAANQARMDQIMRQNNQARSHLSNLLNTITAKWYALDNAIRQPEARPKWATEMDKLRRDHMDLVAKYRALARGREEDALMVRMEQAQAKVEPMYRRTLELALAGDVEAAARMLNDEVTPAAAEVENLARESIALQERRMAEAYAQAQAGYRSVRVWLGVISLALLAVAGAVAAVITRSFTRPIAMATATARALAAGRLDTPIAIHGRDEMAEMLLSLRHVQEELQRFSSEMALLIRLQAGEDIAHRMPEDFEGTYGELARGVNQVLFEHIDAMRESFELMARYAQGDLSGSARRYPGQRAFMHEALDAAKANLAAINGDIQRLAAAAGQGDFSARGDESRYDHAFRDMIRGLNRLMDQAEAGLSDVGRVMAAVADGDLDAHISRHYEGAFGELARSTNRTVAQLSRIVARIQEASGEIQRAAEEILAGNDDLARRTEQQAASLEETAASMGQLTATVRRNADTARQASELAVDAAAAASQGGAVVGQVVSTMAEIQRASHRIVDIIGVIDSIAFQTNILALNAAVEAARAGEQGRGFAVVASEVRALAQRSAAAAKEIKELITDSVEKVAAGNALVDQAGQTIEATVERVRRVTSFIADISRASAEQTVGIEQVSRTVSQLDDNTQQNSAMVEEAHAAARGLEAQAQALVDAVAAFRLSTRNLDDALLAEAA